MPNPTTVKPVQAVYNAAATFGTNLRAMLPLTEGIGLPTELKNNRPGQPDFAGSLSTLAGVLVSSSTLQAPRAGPPPAWVSNGLAGFGNTLKFDHSTRGLIFGGCGFLTAGGNGVTAKTLACVFKHNITSYSRATLAASWQVMGAGTSGTTGIILAAGVTSSVTHDKLRMQFSSANTVTDPLIPMELVAGRWYAMAISISVIATGNTTKTFFLYDITNQVLHPASGQTMVSTANGFIQDQHFLLGDFGSPSANALVGEFAAASLHDEAFDGPAFANYIADPIACARATYSASGSLTTGGARFGDSAQTTTTLTWGRSTGIGTGGGTGAVTYQVWRSTDPTVAVGAGGSTQLSGGLVSSANGNSVVVSDTGLTADTDYWYRLRTSDGTQNLDSSAIYARTKKRTPLKVWVITDSKGQITGVVEGMSLAAIADGRQLTLVNWGRGSTGLTPNNLPTSSRIGSVTAAANQQVTVTAQGTITSGTFKLVFPFNSPITTGVIQWNSTVVQTQAVLDAALGAGVVTVAGSTLPLTQTITGTSGIYQNSQWPLPAMELSSSTLAGTPLVTGETLAFGTTLTVIGSPGTTATNTYLTGRAEALRVGCDKALVWLGANDTANAQWQSDLSAMLADLLANGITPAVAAPETRHTAGSGLVEPTADATFQAFQALAAAAVAANPGAVYSGTRAFGLSCLYMSPETMSDQIHENAGSTFAFAIGAGHYMDLATAFDPSSGGGSGGSGSGRLGIGL